MKHSNPYEKTFSMISKSTKTYFTTNIFPSTLTEKQKLLMLNQIECYQSKESLPSCIPHCFSLFCCSSVLLKTFKFLLWKNNWLWINSCSTCLFKETLFDNCCQTQTSKCNTYRFNNTNKKWTIGWLWMNFRFNPCYDICPISHKPT